MNLKCSCNFLINFQLLAFLRNVIIIFVWCNIIKINDFIRCIANLTIRITYLIPISSFVLFNDIKIEQSLELSNIYLRNQFPECFQLLPKRRSFSDRSFVRNLEVDQFDRLDQIFADYIREKYADNTELAQKMVQKAGQFFHELK